MRFGKLDIDPVKSPAVLDTATWDRDVARREIAALSRRWAAWQPPRAPFLAQLDDGQRVFIRIGDSPGGDPLGEPFFQLALDSGARLSAYPTDAPVIDRFCRLLKPQNAPAALGRTPRLGIGTRMTTLLWPGIFAAMERKGFAASSIQNSVRELNLLDDLKAGKAPERNYASGFGMIECGYTGSTFEGLWVSGVLASLQHDRPLVYGADADHIQVKRADEGLARALRVIDAARYYTFFTLDVADVLSFETLAARGEGETILRQTVTSASARRDILSYHGEPLEVGKRTYRIDSDLAGRCVGKYWRALESATASHARIAALRMGNPFDLEFACDEHPPEVPGPQCMTSEEELLFVARELARRGLPVTHLAPNFGIEKGADYRLPDGLAGLQARVESLHHIAEATGFLLDFHSADDLSQDTRRAISRATSGTMHFKISPSLQLIFAETIRDHAPDIFLAWWNDALAYARVEAENGSPVATACLSAYRSCDDPSPSPVHEVFRQFSFAYPGRFVNREALYALPARLGADYQERVAAHLCALADDLFTA